MRNFSFSNNERRNIENKLKKLRENKINPDDVVLNAAAIQDQLLIDMGLKKKKNVPFKKKPKAETENNQSSLPKMLTKIINKNLDNEKEQTIIKRQKDFYNNLTFAQKVGLKEITKMPLSINEWKKLESQSLNRNDHTSNCPICLDSLSKRESLILSCSHVFHKFCIQNFEKFTNNKKCPICRCANYETKDYYKDKEYFIKISIIIIQKTFRGYYCRIMLYRNIFKHDMPKNKHLRSIYSPWKIKELTNKMCQIIEKKDQETKNIIKGLEKDLREIKKTSEKIKKEVNVKGDDKLFTDWNKILNMRKSDTCAICFCQLNKKDVYLLSCTHCFHKNCLDSFEKFDTYYEKRCPICRRDYEKRIHKF
jgi:hypothetical protein